MALALKLATPTTKKEAGSVMALKLFCLLCSVCA